MRRILLVLCLLSSLILAGCAAKQKEASNPLEDARDYFNHISAEIHKKAVTEGGEPNNSLLEKATIAYQDLIKRYPEASYWKAEALLHMGHAQRLMKRTEAALETYREVLKQYPMHRFISLTAMKSRLDMFREMKYADKAREACREMKQRYSNETESIFQQILKACYEGGK